jgi:hypothetical protein
MKSFGIIIFILVSIIFIIFINAPEMDDSGDLIGDSLFCKWKRKLKEFLNKFFW